MNSKNLLIWLFLLTPVIALSQDLPSSTYTEADTSLQAKGIEPEMMQTLFYNESIRRNQNKRGCSLIQNPWSQRNREVTKNGYKIVTLDKDEVVKVKNVKGGTKITYYNDYETLKYKTNNKGEITYKYSYINECTKIKMKKNKSGKTFITNKSDLETTEVSENILQAIRRGVSSCQHMEG